MNSEKQAGCGCTEKGRLIVSLQLKIEYAVKSMKKVALNILLDL